MTLDTAAASAIAVYDEAGDTLDAMARSLRATDRPLLARLRAQRALIAHRAARAEMFHPANPPVDTTCCGWCATYMNLPSEAKPPLFERVRS